MPYKETRKRREAEVNPIAVKKARVFTGRVAYYDDRGQYIEIHDGFFVQVGSWKPFGQETGIRDRLDTYHAAFEMGLAEKLELLPTEENGRTERRWLISAGYDDDCQPVPYESKELAEQLAKDITAYLKNLRGLAPVDIR